MPWLPELFSAPLVERIQRHAADEREARPVPYFAGVESGETDALIQSFAGEPELHHPVRGRVKGRRAFERFVAQTNTWLGASNAVVDDVERIVTPSRVIEETVLTARHAPGPHRAAGGGRGRPRRRRKDHRPADLLRHLAVYRYGMPAAYRCCRQAWTSCRPAIVADYQRRARGGRRPGGRGGIRARRLSPGACRQRVRASRPRRAVGVSTSSFSPTAAASCWSTARSPTTAMRARWSTTWSDGAEPSCSLPRPASPYMSVAPAASSPKPASTTMPTGRSADGPEACESYPLLDVCGAVDPNMSSRSAPISRASNGGHDEREQ